MTSIKDSGTRREFGTGSVRDMSDKKGDFALLVQGWGFVLRSLARHLQEGAKKYGSSNWLRGQHLSSYLDSATRHLFAFGEGKTDEPHIIAAIWNLMCLVETWFRIQIGQLPQELDDLNVPVIVWDEELRDEGIVYKWNHHEPTVGFDKADMNDKTLIQLVRADVRGLHFEGEIAVDRFGIPYNWNDILRDWERVFKVGGTD